MMTVLQVTMPLPRTVMVYMAANNSLASDTYTNLNQMEEGFTGIDGKLIVYARIFGQEPKYMKLSMIQVLTLSKY
jgi:hypothetical protein